MNDALWCDKKKKWIGIKKAKAKCIKTNLKKRGKVCPYLCLETQYGTPYEKDHYCEEVSDEEAFG